MNKTKKLVYVLLMTILLFVACRKEGPQGPAGPQGKQGVAGEKGEKGDRGPKGTANVIYSDWISLNFEPFGGVYRAQIKIPEISEDFMDKGLVLVYVENTSFVEGGGVKIAFPLPYIIKRADGTITQYIRVSHLLVGILAIDADPKPGNNLLFRYMLIPGEVHARLSDSYSPPKLNYYHAVCKYYKVPE